MNMKILKDLTRKTMAPVPRGTHLKCDLLKAALFAGVAYCGFNIARAFGLY